MPSSDFNTFLKKATAISIAVFFLFNTILADFSAALQVQTPCAPFDPEIQYSAKTEARLRGLLEQLTDGNDLNNSVMEDFHAHLTPPAEPGHARYVFDFRTHPKKRKEGNNWLISCSFSHDGIYRQYQAVVTPDKRILRMRPASTDVPSLINTRTKRALSRSRDGIHDASDIHGHDPEIIEGLAGMISDIRLETGQYYEAFFGLPPEHADKERLMSVTASFLEDADKKVLLAVDKGAVIGFITVDLNTETPGMAAELANMAVIQPRRGEGFGTMLLDRAIDLLWEDGITEFRTITKNEKIINYFRKRSVITDNPHGLWLFHTRYHEDYLEVLIIDKNDNLLAGAAESGQAVTPEDIVIRCAQHPQLFDTFDPEEYQWTEALLPVDKLMESDPFLGKALAAVIERRAGDSSAWEAIKDETVLTDAWLSRLETYSEMDPETAPPIIVAVEGDKYEVVDGNRTLLAAKIRGESTIKAYVGMKPRRLGEGPGAALRNSSEFNSNVDDRGTVRMPASTKEDISAGDLDPSLMKLWAAKLSDSFTAKGLKALIRIYTMHESHKGLNQLLIGDTRMEVRLNSPTIGQLEHLLSIHGLPVEHFKEDKLLDITPIGGIGTLDAALRSKEDQEDTLDPASPVNSFVNTQVGTGARNIVREFLEKGQVTIESDGAAFRFGVIRLPLDDEYGTEFYRVYAEIVEEGESNSGMSAFERSAGFCVFGIYKFRKGTVAKCFINPAGREELDAIKVKKQYRDRFKGIGSALALFSLYYSAFKGADRFVMQSTAIYGYLDRLGFDMRIPVGSGSSIRGLRDAVFEFQPADTFAGTPSPEIIPKTASGLLPKGKPRRPGEGPGAALRNSSGFDSRVDDDGTVHPDKEAENRPRTAKSIEEYVNEQVRQEDRETVKEFLEKGEAVITADDGTKFSFKISEIERGEAWHPGTRLFNVSVRERVGERDILDVGYCTFTFKGREALCHKDPFLRNDNIEAIEVLTPYKELYRGIGSTMILLSLYYSAFSGEVDTFAVNDISGSSYLLRLKFSEDKDFDLKKTSRPFIDAGVPGIEIKSSGKKNEHSAPTAADRLISLFGIDNIGKRPGITVVSESSDHKGHVVRIKVPRTKDASKAPEGGTDLLKFILLRPSVRDVTTLDLVYNDKGELIAVFPVISEKLKPGESYYDNPRFLNLSAYHFNIPAIGDPDAIKAWEALDRKMREDRKVIDAYREASGNSATEVVDDFKSPYVYAEIDKETGKWATSNIFALNFKRQPEPCFDVIPREKDDTKHQIIIPVLPAVYSPGIHKVMDEDFYKYLTKDFPFHKGNETLVVGPGAGLDAWAISLRTGSKIHAIGINPLEVANLKMTAAIAGFEVEAVVGDNIIDEQGRPRFPGKVFDRLVWNMPEYSSKPDLRKTGPPAFETYWDGDADGSILKRLVKGIPLVVKPKGWAILWNESYWRNTPVGEINVIERLLSAAGYVKSIRADNGSYTYFVSPARDDSAIPPPDGTTADKTQVEDVEWPVMPASPAATDINGRISELAEWTDYFTDVYLRVEDSFENVYVYLDIPKEEFTEKHAEKGFEPGLNMLGFRWWIGHTMNNAAIPLRGDPEMMRASSSGTVNRALLEQTRNAFNKIMEAFPTLKSATGRTIFRNFEEIDRERGTKDSPYNLSEYPTLSRHLLNLGLNPKFSGNESAGKRHDIFRVGVHMMDKALKTIGGLLDELEETEEGIIWLNVHGYDKDEDAKTRSEKDIKKRLAGSGLLRDDLDIEPHVPHREVRDTVRNRLQSGSNGCKRLVLSGHYLLYKETDDGGCMEQAIKGAFDFFGDEPFELLLPLDLVENFTRKEPEFSEILEEALVFTQLGPSNSRVYLDDKPVTGWNKKFKVKENPVQVRFFTSSAAMERAISTRPSFLEEGPAAPELKDQAPFIHDMLKTDGVAASFRDKLLSVLTEKKVVLLFEDGIGKSNSNKILDVVRVIKQLKKDPRYKGFLKNLVIQKASSKKIARTIDKYRGVNTEVFLFARNSEREVLKNIESRTHATYIDEKEYDSNCYYPLAEIVTISLSQYIDASTLDNIKGLLEELHIADSSKPGGPIIFTLLPDAEKFDRQDLIKKFAALKRALIAA